MSKKKRTMPSGAQPPSVVIDYKGRLWVNGSHIGQIWSEASLYELELFCELVECDRPVLMEDLDHKPIDG